MLNLFDYDFGVRLIKPDPNIYYRTRFLRCPGVQIGIYRTGWDPKGPRNGIVFDTLLFETEQQTETGAEGVGIQNWGRMSANNGHTKNEM